MKDRLGISVVGGAITIGGIVVALALILGLVQIFGGLVG